MIKITHLHLYYAFVLHLYIRIYVNLLIFMVIKQVKKDLQNHIKHNKAGSYHIVYLKAMPKVFTNSINFYYLFNEIVCCCCCYYTIYICTLYVLFYIFVGDFRFIPHHITMIIMWIVFKYWNLFHWTFFLCRLCVYVYVSIFICIIFIIICCLLFEILIGNGSTL